MNTVLIRVSFIAIFNNVINSLYVMPIFAECFPIRIFHQNTIVNLVMRVWLLFRKKPRNSVSNFKTCETFMYIVKMYLYTGYI